MDKSKIWLSVAQIMTILNRDVMNLTQLHTLLIPAIKVLYIASFLHSHNT